MISFLPLPLSNFIQGMSVTRFETYSRCLVFVLIDRFPVYQNFKNLDALGLSSGTSSAELLWVCKKGNRNGASVNIPSYFVWPLLVVCQMYNGNMWHLCIATVSKNASYSDYIGSLYKNGVSYAIAVTSTTSSVSWSRNGTNFNLTYIWAFSSQ